MKIQNLEQNLEIVKLALAAVEEDVKLFVVETSDEESPFGVMIGNVTFKLEFCKTPVVGTEVSIDKESGAIAIIDVPEVPKKKLSPSKDTMHLLSGKND